jgi:light-regulated signal transduction histidine kinase (bacteriophytochrome)
MLDVPIRIESHIVGIICHEHTRQQRDWTLEQQDFAFSISNSIALALETEERKKAEKEIQDYREHLEELVEKRTSELATVNKELESFSYSVSHDLRSPLRAIDGFSQILLEDYASSLDEQGNDFLHRIRNNIQRMRELIDDLLALSQLSRTPLIPETINLSSITREIMLTLSKNQMDRKVNYQIHDTQNVQGDPKLIKIILENLLQNAWKYTGKTSKPEIEFGAKQQNNNTIFFVKDNGAGFDMKYSDNLFGVFQRLHGDEFEGTGIGLATVQRLINRHGGRIWPEAAVNQGATFFFTLQ